MKLVAFCCLVMCFCLAGARAQVSDAQASSSALTRFTFTQYHMGIDARIVLYSGSEATAEAAALAAFDRIADLEAVMSDYRKDSELMLLCEKAGTGPIPVSADLYRVLAKGQEVSAASNGAFDVTVGPLIQLWRAARKAKKLPTVLQVSAARDLVGWQMMKLDSHRRTVSLARKGMRLDLGGIAKGDAAQEAMKVLKQHGIKSALIEMGGDLVVSNAPPATKGWVVEVTNAEKAGSPIVMPFANCAVSTSGDTEQNTLMAGRRWSHVVDPRTGWALTNRVQATIVVRSGLDSDPLSTAMTVCSDSDREALLKSWPRARLWIRVLKQEK